MRVKIEKLEENVPWKMEDSSVTGDKKVNENRRVREI